MTFGPTINGTKSLTVNAGTGQIIFSNNVGSTNALSALVLTGSGVNRLPSVLRATGAVNLLGTVALGNTRSNTLVAATQITSTANGDITLGDIDGGYALTIANGSGSIDIQRIGASTPLTSLTFSGTGINVLRGDVTTLGAVDLLGTSRSTQLAAHVAIRTTNADVTGGTLDGATGTSQGAYDFVISNGSGDILLGNVGSTIALRSMTFYGTGSNNIGSINTDAGYDLGSDRGMTLHADITYGNPNSTVALGRLTLDDGVTLTLGNGGTAAITVKLISGTAGGSSSNIIINSRGTVLISGTIGTDIGSVTVTDSNGVTFAGAVTVTSQILLSDTTDGSSINFNGTLIAPTLSTAVQGYNLGINATASSITNGVTFTNTGTLSIGASGGTQTYTGGINTTGVTGVVTLKGTLNTTNTPIVLGAISLGADTSIQTNATATAGDLTLGAVTLAGYSLTASTGASVASADVSGTTVSGLGSMTLQNIGGTASFTGSVSATNLTVASTVNHVVLTGSGGTITNAVTFSNVGTLTLGQSGGTQTYAGGLTAVAPSTVTLNGTIQTTNTALTLNAFTLGSDVTLSTNATTSDGLIKFGTITGGNNNLTFASGYISPYTSGAGLLIGSSVNNVSMVASSGTVSEAFTFANAGTLLLGISGGAQTYTGGIVANDPAAITVNGTINSASAAINLGATGKTLTLGSDVIINTYSDGASGGVLTIASAIEATSAGVQSLTIQTKGAIATLSGTVGGNKALGTLTLGDGAQTGTITINAAFTVGTLTTGVSGGTNAFAVTLNNVAGAIGTSTVSNTATFYNTGPIRFGDYLTDVFNFNGGVVSTLSSRVTVAASQISTSNSALNITSPITFETSTTISTGSGRVDLGAVNLSSGATLIVGGASQSGEIYLSSVTGQNGSGAVSNLTIHTTGAVSVSGSIGTRIGRLTVTNSGGITFNGTVGASADLVSLVLLSNTTGTVLFAGDLYATSLSNPASSFDIKLYGSNTRVVDFVTLNTTGTVYFGDLATTIVDCVCLTTGTPDVLTFDRGIRHAGSNKIAGTFTKSTILTCTGSDCGINFTAGTTEFIGASTTIDFGVMPIVFDNIVLANGVTLTLGGGGSGSITVGSIAGIPISAPYGANLNCPSNIVINTTGTFNLLRTIGTNIGLLTVSNSGGATFAGTVDATTGVTLSNTSGTIAFNDT